MKKNYTRRGVAVIAALALTLGVAGGAFAASNTESIKAVLNRGVTVKMNSVVQNLKDANGNPIYPITYNGSTYLPVRAVSDLVGLPVSWDAATNTVNLGTSDKQPVAVTSLKNSGPTKFNWVITDKTELTVSGSDANQTYSNGIQWKIWNGSLSTGKNWMLYFDVKGYNEVSFTAWSDVKCTVDVYDQDYKVITSFELAPDSPTSKTITIPSDATKIAFGANGSVSSKGTLKILDATVK